MLLELFFDLDPAPVPDDLEADGHDLKNHHGNDPHLQNDLPVAEFFDSGVDAVKHGSPLLSVLRFSVNDTPCGDCCKGFFDSKGVQVCSVG